MNHDGISSPCHEKRLLDRERQKKLIDNHEIHFNSNVVVYNHNKVISFDKPSFGKK